MNGLTIAKKLLTILCCKTAHMQTYTHTEVITVEITLNFKPAALNR